MAQAQLRKAGFSGRIVDATSPDYATVLLRASAAAERKAKVIVFPTTAEQVSTAVVFATRNNLEIAIKCGGHHYTTASSVHGGLVIDMGDVKHISIDKQNNQVKVGGGCLWGDVYEALRKENLSCVGGGVHVVGVGGHLTGGGYGPLSSRLGMACDNVLSATVVLADGRIVNASETENSDLFFGIRGGSSSFGVVTQFVLRTFPPQGPFFFRSFGFPAKALSEIGNRFSAFLSQNYADKGLMPFIYLVRGPPPQREPAVLVNFFGFGSVSDFPEAFAPFEALQPFHNDVINCETLVEFSHVIDDLLLEGSPRKSVGSAPVTSFWPGMLDELWQVYLDYTNSNPDALDTKIFLESHSSKRYRPEGTCIPYLEPRHSMIIGSEEHTDPAGDQRADDWAHKVTQVVRKYQKRYGGRDLGVNGNGSSLNEKSEDVWLQNYPRLRKIKAKYDPHKVFNRYFPIEPDFERALL